MRLLIISHTPHHRNANGHVVGWGPTVREIDQLAGQFDSVTHIAWFYADQAALSEVAYSSENIVLVPVLPSGGEGLRDKFRILARMPGYLRTILRELSCCDAVHIRCPSNISMLAILTLAFSTHPRCRWVKYAGNWKPDRGGANDPWSYVFQRWWLNRRLHRGTVTVNGEWPDQPGHVFTFPNPSFAEKEIRAAQCGVKKKKLAAPYRLIFAGRVESEKGIGRALEVCNRLNRNNVPFVFDIIGDGPGRSHFEEVSQLLGLESCVTFHGWLSQQEVQRHFREAHFMLLPTSASEGWPKVLSEAMAFGVVVLAGAVSCIPQNLQKTGAGIALPPEDIDGFEMNIMTYLNNPRVWKTASESGIAAAKFFSYETYLNNVRTMFRKAWNVVL